MGWRGRVRTWLNTSFTCQGGWHHECRLGVVFPLKPCWCDCHFRLGR